MNTNYNSPAIKGTNITFSCNDSQLLLQGPESATCIGNGIWEPDPRNVGCLQKGAWRHTYNCECLMYLCIPPTATVTSGCYGTFAGNICYNSTESPGDAESPSMNHSNNIIAGQRKTMGAFVGAQIYYDHTHFTAALANYLAS